MHSDALIAHNIIIIIILVPLVVKIPGVKRYSYYYYLKWKVIY